MPSDQSPLPWAVLSLPKQGHTADEYEDAWKADPTRGRFAIADGASESAFASLWARLLTEGFVAAHRPRTLDEWLEAARQRWLEEVMGLDLPWYAEMKREQGAFATLLGVSVRRATPERPGQWRAVAVGDSCVIRVRKSGKCKSFPLHRSSDFGNQPSLLGSRPGVRPACQQCAGSLRPGDRLLLMTDALAQWFLCSYENGKRPVETIVPLLCDPQPEAAFVTWIAGLRTRGELRNDDVTLLNIEPNLAQGFGVGAFPG